MKKLHDGELSRKPNLSRNNFMTLSSHEIHKLSRNDFMTVRSHEIYKLSRNNFMTVSSHERTKLSRNNFMTVSSHEMPNSHGITSWRWPLTKYPKNRHENTDANLAITLFSWVWPSWWTLMKIIHGGKLSRKCVFRESISVRGDAWRCTLTHYFRESKTVFRDCFSLSWNIRILVLVRRKWYTSTTVGQGVRFSLQSCLLLQMLVSNYCYQGWYRLCTSLSMSVSDVWSKNYFFRIIIYMIIYNCVKLKLWKKYRCLVVFMCVSEMKSWR
jgi:hypothetical protein